MKYNHKEQPYEIVGRFSIFNGKEEVEYCRVRFALTGCEQAVTCENEKSGRFEDLSLLLKEESKIIINPETITSTVTSTTLDDISCNLGSLKGGVSTSESTVVVSESEISLSAPEVKEPNLEVNTDELDASEHIVEEEKTRAIMATDPEGKEVTVDDLEAFVAEHGLDMEAVEACLDGKQKTHKKFKFRYE